MDLLLDPEFALYCLDKLFDLAYTETVRIYDQIPGQVTMSYIAEDFGSQVSLLFSPQTIREVFVPRMKRMMDLAHSAGAYVFFHSDGAVRPIIPDMIAAGIDILNPLQWRCRGMEREGIKRDFGDQVVLHGGVDNQYTLAVWQRGRSAGRSAREPGRAGQGRRLHPRPVPQYPADQPAGEHRRHV